MKNPKDIIKSVCKRYGITLKELNSNRISYYIKAKREIIFLLRTEGLPYSYIGKLLNLDHSSCIYHFKKFTKKNDTPK